MLEIVIPIVRAVLTKTDLNGLPKKLEQILFDFSKNYTEKYYKFNNNIRTIEELSGRAKTIESVFVPISLIENWRDFDYNFVKTISDLYSLEERYKASTETVDWLTVVNSQKYLIIVGDPGNGKSTLLRRVGLEALKEKNSKYIHKCIPVFVQLKYFTSENIAIEEQIANDFSLCGLPHPRKFTKRALKQGKLLILFDGLDEVPSTLRETVISRINQFVQLYNCNRFIVSCREAAYKHYFFQGFRSVKTFGFKKEQIKLFIEKWFSDEESTKRESASTLWRLLQDVKYESCKELAKTPLLLTYICQVYNRTQSLYNNRSALYKKALDILLTDWSYLNNINRDEMKHQFQTTLEEMFLAKIAYKGFCENRIFFKKNELIDDINQIIFKDNINVSQDASDGFSILEAITVQQGILVKVNESDYSFSHFGLQEYLAAKYIKDNDLIRQLVNVRITDSNWREIFPLLSGLMQSDTGADKLIYLIEEESKKCIRGNSKLQSLLKWAADKTLGSSGDITPLKKRAIAIFISRLSDFDNINGNSPIRIKNHDITDIEKFLSVLDKNIDISSKSISLFNSYKWSRSIHRDIRALDSASMDEDSYKRVKERVSKNISSLNICLQDSIDFYVKIDQYKIFRECNFQTLLSLLRSMKRITQSAVKKWNPTPYKKFRVHVWDEWKRSLKLNRSDSHLTPFDSQALARYFTINNRIICCRLDAVKVSPQLFLEIENRMIREQNDSALVTHDHIYFSVEKIIDIFEQLSSTYSITGSSHEKMVKKLNLMYKAIEEIEQDKYLQLSIKEVLSEMHIDEFGNLINHDFSRLFITVLDDRRKNWH